MLEKGEKIVDADHLFIILIQKIRIKHYFLLLNINDNSFKEYLFIWYGDTNLY